MNKYEDLYLLYKWMLVYNGKVTDMYSINDMYYVFVRKIGSTATRLFILLPAEIENGERSNYTIWSYTEKQLEGR